MIRLLQHVIAPRAASGWLWAGILVLLLAACGGLEAPPLADNGIPTSGSEHAYIASVEIDAGADRAAIASAYGGEVVVWRPEAGFAIIGLPDEASTLGRPDHTPGARPTLPAPANAARNVDAFFVPALDAAHVQGVNAWAGGVSAWAGGVSAWAGGVSNPFPGNEATWSQINLGQAQDVATKRGAGITVAVIDTGIDVNHVGFVGRLSPSGTWLDLVDGDLNPHEGYVVACTRFRGKNCIESGPVKTGDGIFFGHGTAVAGVVLQAAPNATVLPIRVLSSHGFGSATNVAIAIDHAVARGANVINLSLGTFEPVPAIDQMVAFAQSRGVIVVAASGNSGDTNVMYPAATAARADFPLAISVGSVDATDRRSWFSTYGSGLEMVAPGEGVTTLYPGDAMAIAYGTSFSAPWVSGVAALALGDGARPNTAPSVVDASVNINGSNPGMNGLLGKGRLDSLAAVSAALGR